MRSRQTGYCEGRAHIRRLVLVAIAALTFVELFGLPHVRLWDGSYWSVTGSKAVARPAGGRWPLVLLIEPDRSPVDRAGDSTRRAWARAHTWITHN